MRMVYTVWCNYVKRHTSRDTTKAREVATELGVVVETRW